MAAYKRILLKLSGEALMGDDAYGINRATIVRMVREIQEVTQLGVEVAAVIGGGNIFRGVAGGAVGMDRATADYMGMLATVMNALALADTMRQEGMTARVMSAIAIEQVVEPYVRPKALQYLDDGRDHLIGQGSEQLIVARGPFGPAAEFGVAKRCHGSFTLIRGFAGCPSGGSRACPWSAAHGRTTGTRASG